MDTVSNPVDDLVDWFQRYRDEQTGIFRILLNDATLSNGDHLILKVPLIVFIVIVIVWVLSLRWIWRDAERRGRNGFIAILFAVITGWPISLVWWLWLRPLPLQPPIPRPLLPPTSPPIPLSEASGSGV